MKYLVLCTLNRHLLESETPIKVNDTCKCFESCPMKGRCKSFAEGQFKVRSVGTINNNNPAIKVVKQGDVYVSVGGSTQSVAPSPKPTSAPAPKVSAPVFGFKPLSGGEQAPQNPINPEQPKPAPAPVFEAPKPVQPEPAQVAPNPEPAAQVQSGFPSRSAFPSRDNPQPQAKPAGSSFSDRFRSQFQTSSTPKVSLTDNVSIDKYSQVSVGGRIYSDNIFGAVNTLNRPLPLIRLFDEIRGHYLMEFVFENNHKLTDKFIWLMLKLHVFPSKEKEEKISRLLSDTLHDNPQTDLIQKFFYVMQLVTPPSMNNGFYIADGYSFNRLVPLFADENDYITKFLNSSQTGAQFRSIVHNHLFEVMYYLGYTTEWPTKENREQMRMNLIEKHEAMFDQFVIRHYEQTGRIVHISHDVNAIEIEEIANIEFFINAMKTPQKLDFGRKLMDFLSSFRITKDQVMLPRDPAHPLIKTVKPDFEGSAVYEALGLKNSALYLEEYDVYTTTLKEYIDNFHPENVSINGILAFSKSNFISEVKHIVLEASEASFAIDLDQRQSYLNKALLLYSLIERKVLDALIASNQSKASFNEMCEILKALSQSNLTVEDYLRIFKKDALFYLGGEHLNQQKYFAKNVELSPLNVIMQKIKVDPIMKGYITLDDRISKAVDQTISKYESAYTKAI